MTKKEIEKLQDDHDEILLLLKQNKNEKGQRMVKHKDARLLRECLAGVFHIVTTDVKVKITNALRAYADQIEKYCDHSDRSWVAVEDRFACLDCGKRLKEPPPNTKTHIPMKPPLQKSIPLFGLDGGENDT